MQWSWQHLVLLLLFVCLFSFFFRKKKSGKSALYIETEELREAAATGFVRLVRVRIARREVTGFDRLHHIARLFLHRVHADGPMPVDIGDERPERLFDIRRVQCGCLDVSRRDLHRTGSFSVGDSLNISRLGVAFGIVGEHGANMPLIGFITDQNDRTVHAGIRSDFVEPRAAKECVRFFRGGGVVRVPLIETLECRRFENVEDEQSTERIAIVGFGNGHETFLTGCERERQATCEGKGEGELTRVPQLYFDRFAVDLHLLGGELDADGRPAFERELVAREARQQVRFAHARVAGEHDLENVVSVG